MKIQINNSNIKTIIQCIYHINNIIRSFNAVNNEKENPYTNNRDNFSKIENKNKDIKDKHNQPKTYIPKPTQQMNSYM